LRCSYRVTLGRSHVPDAISPVKQPRRLSVVLIPEEVAHFFAAIRNVKHRPILMTAYAAGLRISEVTALEVSDIDSKRMVIRVRHGKGRKDRYVMLCPRVLEFLRAYWKAIRPQGIRFPGAAPDRPITTERGREADTESPWARGRHPISGGSDRSVGERQTPIIRQRRSIGLSN
jgi:integrase